MSDSLGTEQPNSIPDAGRTRTFPRVYGHAPAGVASTTKMFGEKMRRKICFVPRQIKSHDPVPLTEQRGKLLFRNFNSVSPTKYSDQVYLHSGSLCGVSRPLHHRFDD